jgi:2-iminobutanoate/2-iminopropanoate deaminase
MSGRDLPLTPAVQAGGWVVVSGQLGVREGRLASTEVGGQTRAALHNVADLLSRHGLTLADIVKTTVYLTSMEHFNEMNDCYRSVLRNHAPARTAVAVLALPVAGALVEIEAWARSPHTPTVPGA